MARVNYSFWKYVADNQDVSFEDLADKLTRHKTKIPYSKAEFDRLTHGIHMVTRFDCFMFWLIDNKLQKLIEWEE